MGRLKCSHCKEYVAGGWTGYVRHLQYTHGFTINRGGGQKGYECAQDGCQKRFLLPGSLRKHLKKEHLQNDDDDDYSDNNDNLGEYTNRENVVRENHNSVLHEIDEGNAEAADAQAPIYAENINLQSFIRESCVRMIGRLQVKPSMTGSILTDVVDEFELVLSTTVDFLKHKVSEFLRDRNMLPECEELLNDFKLESPCEGLKTLNEQIEALKTHFNYIDGKEIPFDDRMDNALDTESATTVPTLVKETYQYVSIIEVLSLIMSNREVRNAIMSERPPENDILSSHIDGDYFKQHPFFQRFVHALRIQLYYDDLEIVGPLGSKTGVHKLGVFYYIIQNLPPHMNSQTANIHVLCLSYTEDVKKYGFRRVLREFMRDLNKLESDDGVAIKVGEEDFVLRASLAAFCGDGLAVHEVFGLLGPSANKFCRMCLISREHLHAGDLKAREERTKELFNTHIRRIKTAATGAATQIIQRETGVHNDCPLNSSRYFHISQNKIFDVMHDFLCGIVPMVLKLTIHHYVFESHLFTLSHLNGQIASFQYGFTEKKNKPSSNFTDTNTRNIADRSLSQKAMQTWCLIRVFPFLVTEKVPRDDRHMNLVLLLLRIMEIVFAPRITKSLLLYLKHLINDFLEVFRELYPAVNYINKLHHLVHYPDCIAWAGPLILYWCMRFEGKHGEIKERAQVVHNFKNCPKTLLRVCQCAQSAQWGNKDLKVNSVSSEGGKSVEVEDTLSRQELMDLGYAAQDVVFTTKSTKVNGVEFRKQLLVCLDAKGPSEEINVPQFGIIQEIIVTERKEVYLRCIQCITLGFRPHLNAYSIQIGDLYDSVLFLPPANLAHYKPMSIWTEPSSDELFVSLRHIIV